MVFNRMPSAEKHQRTKDTKAHGPFLFHCCGDIDGKTPPFAWGGCSYLTDKVVGTIAD